MEQDGAARLGRPTHGCAGPTARPFGAQQEFERLLRALPKCRRARGINPRAQNPVPLGREGPRARSQTSEGCRNAAGSRDGSKGSIA